MRVFAIHALIVIESIKENRGKLWQKAIHGGLFIFSNEGLKKESSF